MMLKRFLAVFALLAVPAFSFAGTSISTLSEKYPHPACRTKLSTLAQQEIRDLKHRFHTVSDTYQTDKNGFAISPFSAFGVIDYHDRSQLVNFFATPVSTSTCHVQITKQYVVASPCVALREESFKRWEFLGRLSDHVFTLKRKRRDNETVYLSQHDHGKECQVLIQQTYQAKF